MMKFNLVPLLALSLLACITPAKSDSCYIYRKFESSSDLVFILDSVEDFNVAPFANTTCTTKCDAGGGFLSRMFVRYGGSASALQYDGAEIDHDGCDMSVTITDNQEQHRLGYRLVINGDFENLELTCKCTKEGDGRSWCFSESALVETRDKGLVSMKDLQTGDYVFSGHNKRGQPRFQPVYSFGHFQPTNSATFLQIYTGRKMDPLEVTGDHLVYLSTEDGQQYAVSADTVKVGDLLVEEHPTLMIPFASMTQASPVTKISTVEKQGLYMPLTPDGTLVVDGIKVSNYVALHTVAPKTVLNAFAFGLTERDLQHWWLTPHRMLCMGVSSAFCGKKISKSFDREEGILKWLLVAKKLLLFVEERNDFVRVFVIGIPLFLLFSFSRIVETIFGAAWAPAVLLFLVADSAILWCAFHGMRAHFFGRQLFEIRDHLLLEKKKA